MRMRVLHSTALHGAAAHRRYCSLSPLLPLPQTVPLRRLFPFAPSASLFVCSSSFSLHLFIVMASSVKQLLGNGVQEIRFAFCQTGAPSASLRSDDQPAAARLVSLPAAVTLTRGHCLRMAMGITVHWHAETLHLMCSSRRTAFWVPPYAGR